MPAKTQTTKVVIDGEEVDIDFSDIEARYAVKEPDTLGSLIVVDGAPIVDEEKQTKLIEVVKKVFKNIGAVKAVHMPKDPATKKSKGYLFMEFETPEQAALAVNIGNGYSLDKKHTLLVNKFDEVPKYANAPEVYTPPTIEEFVEKPHLRSWLIDEKARDQFVIMKGDDVGVYWNNKAEQPDLVHNRANWSDMYVSWSPMGTYLATFHKQGIVLWGGPQFEKIVRFPHPNVKLIDFSPKENYLVSWSHDPIAQPNGDLHHVIVWDIQSGQQLRSFSVTNATSASADAKGGPGSTIKIDWPLFKWSHNEKYLARMTAGKDGLISVYETPGMGLLDKKSIKIENLKAFEWSPTECILSYWTSEPEVGNIPARVTLMRLPSREIVRTKNLFSVVNANMHWQSNGDYLLVRVERAKTKKQTVTNLEIFRLREKDVPVDVVETKPNETITNVFWEPKGERFALLTAEGAAKIFIHFYEMNKMDLPVASTKKGAAVPSANQGGAALLRSLERKGINHVLWSPKGRIAVLAGIRAFQGELEFWDIDDMVMLGAGEHYMCTDVEWDPSGRYVLSSISYWRNQTDTGFMLWNSVGQNLTKQNVSQFKQILWRSRPPTPLSEEEQKLIKKKMKEYTKEFEEVDTKESSKVVKEVIEKRQNLWKEWAAYRQRCVDEYVREAPLRNEIVGFDLEEDARQEARTLEQYVDEVIDEKEEIIGDADDDEE
ncbi:Translation initiation factor 3 subunit b [Chytridiales sp. JEL 0842]|nr:Translation initiation factor 3 subunit b [Chytridiales sp. JEL 0842]